MLVAHSSTFRVYMLFTYYMYEAVFLKIRASGDCRLMTINGPAMLIINSLTCVLQNTCCRFRGGPYMCIKPSMYRYLILFLLN